MGRLYRNANSFEVEKAIKTINEYPENTNIWVLIGEQDILLTKSAYDRNYRYMIETGVKPPFPVKLEYVTELEEFIDGLIPEDESFMNIKLVRCDGHWTVDLSNFRWTLELDKVDEYFAFEDEDEDSYSYEDAYDDWYDSFFH